jgi:hypothetical protein
VYGASVWWVVAIRFGASIFIFILYAYDAVKALPAWFPGMGWKSEAAECRRLVSDGLNTPFAWVKRRLVRAEINAHVRLCG